jgi:alkanesulfonate monooxygenase SsuD/methylene tetrahydromethanopterin reductase-like flavin-dependent oxidoreductase (luciferase family)
MPIYEFYSPDTHKIYSFYARSLAYADKVPRCPENPKARMERLVSQFSVTGRAKEKHDDADSGMDPKMESMMAEMEREMAGIDENNPDPRQLGRLMRKMTEATGQKVPEEMEHMLRRLESGEDPEKLEEEFGDALDDLGEGGFGEDPEGGEDARNKVRSLFGRRRLKRDPKLYEINEFLADSR